MATKKSGGAVQHSKNSPGQRLGQKSAAGQRVKAGSILYRQRGTRWIPGANVYVSKDQTLHAEVEGVVSFREVRKENFNGQVHRRTEVSIVPVVA